MTPPPADALQVGMAGNFPAQGSVLIAKEEGFTAVGGRAGTPFCWKDVLTVKPR